MIRTLLSSCLVALVALFLAGPAHAQSARDQVEISLDDFLEMYDRVKEGVPPLAPPRDASVASLAFDGRITLDDAGEPVNAVLDLVATVIVHRDRGLVRVPLVGGDVAVLSATIGGRTAPVTLTNDAFDVLLGPGSHEIKLQIVVGTRMEGVLPVFRVRLPAAGAVTARVFLPGDVWTPTAPGAEVLERAVTSQGTRLRVSLPSTQPLRLAWTRTVPEDEARETPRIDATVGTLLEIGDGVVHATAIVDHTIRFHGVDVLRFAVPDGYAVLDVTALGLTRWQTDDGVLEVTLGRELLGLLQVRVDLERVLTGDGSVQAPLLRPLGVERVKGHLGVTALGTLEVEAADVASASAVDVRALPAGLVTRTQQPLLLGFKYLDDAARVGLVVTQHDDVAVLVTLLDQCNAVSMFTRDGRRITSVTWSVRNNRRQFLRVKMPAGSELWSAAVAGETVQPSKDAHGDVLVPLVRSADEGGAVTAFGVELVYVETMPAPDASGAGSFEADLPAVDVPTTYVAWRVYVPSEARVDTRHVRGNVRAVPQLSRPLGGLAAMSVPSGSAAQEEERAQNARSGQAASGGMGSGAGPVRVNLPLEGRVLAFEKLLALDETLHVGFDYKGIK